jgi:hypothetical protein
LPSLTTSGHHERKPDIDCSSSIDIFDFNNLMAIRRRALASLSGDSCGDIAQGVGNIFLGHSAMATSGEYSSINVSDTDIVDFC